jgi:pimeloyl-ACP methyl ester carboxylesterase
LFGRIIMLRDTQGRRLVLNGGEIYLEESGSGPVCVVFESGNGAGRTLWDPVVPLLSGIARTVAYDRAGRGRSPLADPPQSLDDMAATLAALVRALAPGRLILVGHSMGGLIARRAAGELVPGPAGLVLVDPTPEAAPIYDDWAAAAASTDRILAAHQAAARCRPLIRRLTRSYGRMFSPATYETMLAEDFTPAGAAQTRRETKAFAAGVREFRTRPPQVPPGGVIVISAARASRLQARNHATVREYQRRWAGQAGAQFEDADSGHIVPAEQPGQVAAAVRRLAGV